MIANYHSIETFSSVDGPGVRYVLFLQGCNMNCKYCHNIDTVPITKNKQISVDEVVNDYLKYSKFYKNGGITISGGEPLLQVDFIIALFKELKKHNVHTCIETQGSLFRKNQNIQELISLTDLFIVDLKGVDNKFSTEICGQKIDNTLMFLDHLNKINSKFLLTYVLMPGLNDDEYCIKMLASILGRFDISNRSFKVNRYRRLGVDKWKNLNLEYKLDHLLEPSKKDVEIFVNKVKTELLRQLATN